MKNYLLFFLAFYSPIIFGQVELFENPLISNDEAFGIAISPKGDDLLYVNSFGGRDTLRIYHSKKINGKWQKPEPSFFSNDRINQIDPSYSPDGENILINAYVSDAKQYDVYLLVLQLSFPSSMPFILSPRFFFPLLASSRLPSHPFPPPRQHPNKVPFHACTSATHA